MDNSSVDRGAGMEKTSADFSNEIDEKDKEISQAITVLETVHQEILALRKQRIELDSSVSKARYNLEKLKIERSLLKSAFWHCKNQGL